jgi:hypothetical protein
MVRNLITGLRQRHRAAPMQAHDALPREVRLWVHEAALPWSAASLRRLWARALRQAGGDADAARARLDAAEARALAREAARVWGPGYPCATPRNTRSETPRAR